MCTKRDCSFFSLPAALKMEGFVDVLKYSGEMGKGITDKSRHHKVYRFIRHGVDKIMEREGKPTTGSNPAHKGFGRVAYFLASGVEKEASGRCFTSSLPPSKKHNKYVSCFIMSKNEKGEGHPGGGNGPDFLNIGLNPHHHFKEVRVKRQQKQTDHDDRKLPRPLPLDRKSSSEILRHKLQHEELLAEIKANNELKSKQREDMEREKMMEYEGITKYNPWGQPSAGAPKVSTNGKLYAHLCGIKLDEDCNQKYDLFGQPRRAMPASENDGAQWWRRGKPFEWSLSEFERNRILEGKDRCAYQVECLKRQKARKNLKNHDETDSSAGFIWGKSKDVNRNRSGKIGPRRRRLYSLDHGTHQESDDTYFSIADKMVRRMPANLPDRGVVNQDSYRTWGKPGSAAIMRNRANRRLVGKTSSNDCTSDGQCKDSGSTKSSVGVVPSTNDIIMAS